MSLKETLGKNFYFKRFVPLDLVLPPDLVPRVNKKDLEAYKEADDWVSKYGALILYARGLIRKNEYVYFEDGNVFTNIVVKPSLSELMDIAKVCGQEHFSYVRKMKASTKIIKYLQKYYCNIL